MRTVALAGLLALAAATAYADADPKWVELASATPAHNGTEYVAVGAEAGKLAELRLDAVGDVFVRRVEVRYRSGKTKTVAIERRLDKSATIDVGDQLVDSVVVTTDRAGKGSYTVLGMAGADVAER